MRRLLCAGVVLVGLLLCGPLVRTASAEVTNNGLSCIATLNNSSASGRSSSDTAEAIDVDSGTSVEVRMTADKTITHYTVQMGWGDVTPWTAADNSASGTGWAQRVNVDQYAKYGIGLYRVSATTVGPDGSCTMAALVNVHGQPIPNTVAGDAAGGLALASGLLFGATAASASSGGGDGGGGGSGESDDDDDDVNPYAGPDERVARSLIPPDMRPVVCWSALPMALMLTALAVMGVVGAPGGSPRSASVYRRARWRPMFSVASILSALVGALSVVVLLQQYGKLQPTTRVLITAGVAALLVAIVVPSLLRLIPVSRYNRRVARREAARAARPSGPPSGSPPPGYPPAGYPPAGYPPAGSPPAG